MATASAAVDSMYVSPITGERTTASMEVEKIKKLSKDPVAKAGLEARLEALKPRARIQRAVELTDDERHAHEMEQQRVRRAIAKKLAVVLNQLMLDLRSSTNGCGGAGEASST